MCRKIVKICLASLLLANLTACGLKGPLYQPKPQPEPEQQPETSVYISNFLNGYSDVDQLLIS